MIIRNQWQLAEKGLVGISSNRVQQLRELDSAHMSSYILERLTDVLNVTDRTQHRSYNPALFNKCMGVFKVLCLTVCR